MLQGALRSSAREKGPTEAPCRTNTLCGVCNRAHRLSGAGHWLRRTLFGRQAAPPAPKRCSTTVWVRWGMHAFAMRSIMKMGEDLQDKPRAMIGGGQGDVCVCVCVGGVRTSECLLHAPIMVVKSTGSMYPRVCRIRSYLPRIRVCFIKPAPGASSTRAAAAAA